MDAHVLEVAGPDVGKERDPRGPADAAFADATSTFVALRPQLVKAAYRILGDPGDAEDVVQEVWIRWQRTDRAAVRNAPAFLTTIAVRLALNVARSARRRREITVGAWTTEPVDRAAEPSTDNERRDDAERAFALLLERLTPAERAAYVLREGFAYPYRQISDVLELGVANARQIVSRAHHRLGSARQAPIDRATRRRLVQAFVAAARAGDLPGLELALTADVTAATVVARQAVAS